MGELIGPYQGSDFYLMSELRKSNMYLAGRDYARYSIAIKKQRDILIDLYNRRFK